MDFKNPDGFATVEHHSLDEHTGRIFLGDIVPWFQMVGDVVILLDYCSATVCQWSVMPFIFGTINRVGLGVSYDRDDAQQ
ncbi:hypothetical protein D3C81_833490 [compost metagenome]